MSDDRWEKAKKENFDRMNPEPSDDELDEGTINVIKLDDFRVICHDHEKMFLKFQSEGLYDADKTHSILNALKTLQLRVSHAVVQIYEKDIL